VDGGRKLNKAEIVLQSDMSLSFEHQSEDFKLYEYTSTERKPMEFLKHKGRDTRVLRKASYKSSSCVEDRLKRRKPRLRKTNEKRIATGDRTTNGPEAP